MDLPNYFLADLPDSSMFSAQLISEGCRTLKENRAKFLAARKTDNLITILASLALDWQDTAFPFRRMVLDRGPECTGLPREILAAGLSKFFARITRQNLERLIAHDLGSVRRLDEIVSDESELKEERASMACGLPLLVHFTGGVIPNAVLTSIILGLLVRSAQFVKCASGTAFIPRMFAHSLYVVQPKLAACLEIAEWKGGNETLEAPLFHEASCVTATGSDQTLEEMRKRVPARARFLGYGHKLSFAYVTRESLARTSLANTVAAAAEDIVAWNQLGCLSPHVIYAETGGAVSPETFAESLGTELQIREGSEPRGAVSTEVSAAIATRRMFYEVRASSDAKSRIWNSPDSTAWTVIYETDPEFQISCLNRFVFVKAVADLQQLFAAAATIQSHLSTVGISAPHHRAHEIATELARWGALRVCRLGRMQDPPLTWRHDGRPSLGDLVTWTDFEF